MRTPPIGVISHKPCLIGFSAFCAGTNSTLPRLGFKTGELPVAYNWRKVWQEGLEVAIKVKGSQGRPRRERFKVEYLWTTISSEHEVHANHCEAHNATIRRRCSAFEDNRTSYAKTIDGLTSGHGSTTQSQFGTSSLVFPNHSSQGNRVYWQSFEP